MQNTKVITRSGGTPQKAINFIKSKPDVVSNYEIIVLHVGTNWLSSKEEWALYLKKVNGLLSENEYVRELCKLNPPPAIGDALRFCDTYQDLVNLIRCLNKEATILVSSIIPRLWDDDRRNKIRDTYNRMLLREFNPQPKVFFINSYRPFFTTGGTLKKHLYDHDGLHLSAKGAVVLRTYLCEKIDKARRNVLK